MKKLHLVKTVCAVGISAACVWGLAGCTGGNGSSGGSGTDSVAATVNGVEISEGDVTKYIENLRTQYGMTDEDSWGKYLVQLDKNPAEFREQVIDAFVTREVIRAHAADRGVTVDDAEVNGYVDQMKSNYENDEKWQAALEQSGMTEDDYRAEVKLQLTDKYLKESFTVDEDPSEADQLQYAQMYATAYDGARRSSHILFDSGAEATAQEVLDKINSGALDFAEAAKEYSHDTASAEKGGDIGWDKTSKLVTEYQDALNNLQKDQVSGLVTSTYGIHIIKCTDVYQAPKTKAEDGTEKVEITSVDQIPSDWLDTIKQSLKSQAQSEAYQKWVDEQREASDVKINDMPADVPYNVDVTKYKTDESADQSGNSTDQGAQAGSADNSSNNSGNADNASSEGEQKSEGSGQPAEAS
ncbi:peptidylprolyl isomerase [Paraeggerthella hongkongensis]|uniref:peptidylprolyl isomerase n=1 Tax=Paraeggerthella sp. TaxID=2897350 RepID=UPI000DF7838F|nr:peptidylprolyl isomerase [Paraeggerthella hongkongensis]